jgi:DNA-binding winged helix-turn-helix (wHTH) protein/TolB-like protein
MTREVGSGGNSMAASTASTSPRLVRFGPYEADPRTGELRKYGIKLKISGQPMEILALLLHRSGEVVTREEIRTTLWPENTFVDFDHSLNTAINKLREALGDSAENPTYIETLPRRGYRFVAPVEVIPAGSRDTLQPIHKTGAAMPPGRQRRFQPLLFAASILVVAAASFSIWALWPRPAVESVAVLPFATDDPSLQYLGDGIAETLTDNLSHVADLRVLSRNSAFQLRGTQVSTREMAKRLGVRALVIGSVKRRDDGTLRVSVELVDGREDRHLWGEEYAVQTAQLASAQPRIAQDVFFGLRYRLDPTQKSRLGHRYTSNPEAYDAYLRGMFAVRHRDTQNLPAAAKLFEESVRLDPNFALAYNGVQAAYGIAAGHGLMRPSEALPLAEAATQRALQIAPDLAESHVAAAYQQVLQHHNLAAALAEAERAVQLDPNLPEAHHVYAYTLLVSRQFDKAVEQGKIAIQLDPEWMVAKGQYISTLVVARHLDEAEEEARRMKPHDPMCMAKVLLAQHRYDEAIRELSNSAADPDEYREFFLAWAQAGLGRPGPLRDLLQKQLELRRKQYVMSSQIARGYAILLDRANTLAWMKVAIVENDVNYMLPVLGDTFDFLHDDPEYQQLCRKMFTPQ